MTVKLGLMVPANNTTMEPELLDWLPGAQCRTLRIPRGKGLLEPLLARQRARQANRHIPDPLRAGRILDIVRGRRDARAST